MRVDKSRKDCDFEENGILDGSYWCPCVFRLELISGGFPSPPFFFLININIIVIIIIYLNWEPVSHSISEPRCTWTQLFIQRKWIELSIKLFIFDFYKNTIGLNSLKNKRILTWN